MTKTNIVRENDYIYITQMENGWYNAQMKGLSVSKIGNDLDILEEEFTDYVRALCNRFKGEK